jgi:hypothetical protein
MILGPTAHVTWSPDNYAAGHAVNREYAWVFWCKRAAIGRVFYLLGRVTTCPFPTDNSKWNIHSFLRIHLYVHPFSDPSESHWSYTVKHMCSLRNENTPNAQILTPWRGGFIENLIVAQLVKNSQLLYRPYDLKKKLRKTENDTWILTK